MMGWWETVDGHVIGDPPLDYMEQLVRLGCRWDDPPAIPGEVLDRLRALYMEGLGREPTDHELAVLLATSSKGTEE